MRAARLLSWLEDAFDDANGVEWKGFIPPLLREGVAA